MNNNFNYFDENEIESQFDIEITDISNYPQSKLVQLIGIMHLQSRSNFSKTIDDLGNYDSITLPLAVILSDNPPTITTCVRPFVSGCLLR